MSHYNSVCLCNYLLILPKSSSVTSVDYDSLFDIKLDNLYNFIIICNFGQMG